MNLHPQLRNVGLGLVLAAAALVALADTAPAVHVRGSIEAVGADSLTVKERSGAVVQLALPTSYALQEVVRVGFSALQPDALVDIAAAPGQEGVLEALAVVVYPEPTRGTQAGHRAWDLRPGSSLTTGTVADLADECEGRGMTVRFKNLAQVVRVPYEVPVVTIQPGERGLVKAGAKVFIVVEQVDGRPTVTRLVVGREGFVPPI